MSTFEGSASPQRAAWLRLQRRRRRRVAAARVGLLALLLAAWELAARCGAIDVFITSSPSRLAQTVLRLCETGELWRHLGATTAEATAGFLLGTLAGAAIAVALWCSPFLCRVLEPYLVILNALPKIALGPVFIVWLGASRRAVVVITLTVSVVVAALEILGGFLSTDAEKILLVRTLGGGRLEALRRVVLPANVPTLLSSLKISVGMAWVGVIVGEFLISREGLGYLIVYGSQVFRLDLVMASVAVLAAVASAMYLCIQWVEQRLTRRRGG